VDGRAVGPPRSASAGGSIACVLGALPRVSEVGEHASHRTSRSRRSRVKGALLEARTKHERSAVDGSLMPS
jgi:hypothetical protein